MLLRIFLHVLGIVLFLTNSASESSAQVLNIDRQVLNDSTLKKNRFTSKINIIADKQKRNLYEITNSVEWDHFFIHDKVLIGLLFTDLSLNGTTPLENNGYLQFRFRDNDVRKVAPDYFVQYQWNGIWGLENRSLIGCNARFKFWEDRSDDLYISTGLFYEFEKWNAGLSAYAFSNNSVAIIYRNLLRTNFMIKTAIKLNKHIDVAALSYIQFPLNLKTLNDLSVILEPRWTTDVNLNYSINRHFGLQLRCAHNLDYYRALPIDLFFYDFNFGFLMQW